MCYLIKGDKIFKMKGIIFNKINNVFSRINYPILAVILVFTIGIITLFINPIVGMADNGDFYRIINQNNIYHLNKDYSDVYFGYFNKDYGIYQYNNDSAKMIISTQSIFIQIALFLNNLFRKDYIFDIRFMAAIFLVIHAIASYFIIKVLTNKLTCWKYKMIITLSFIFIFCDTGYLAYYNSFFGEAVNTCCFLIAIGILLYAIEFNKLNFLFLSLFGLFSFLFFGAKQQLAPVGILIAFIFIQIGILKSKKALKYFCFLSSIFFIVSAGIFYKSIEGDFIYSNTYHSMNRGMLLYEDDPDKVLGQFNINNQYSLLQGTNFFEGVPLIDPKDESLIEDYYKKYPLGKVLIYYAKNPSAFTKVIRFGFKNAYSIRPKVMGNFEKSANKPFGMQSRFFTLWSTFKDQYLPKNLGFSIGVILIYLYISGNILIKAIKRKDINEVLKQEYVFYIFLAGLSQIVISVLGAGDADLSKHEFMYNISFDFILIYMISIYLEKKQLKSGVGKSNE